MNWKLITLLLGAGIILGILLSRFLGGLKPEPVTETATAGVFPEPFPPALDPWREKLYDARLPAFDIITHYSRETPPWASKFLGTPYLPKGVDYPVGTDAEGGYNLQMVVQINFAECLPHPLFPDEGIFQIFLGEGDDQYGLDWDRTESFFKSWREDPATEIPRSDIAQDPEEEWRTIRFVTRWFPEVHTDPEMLNPTPPPPPRENSIGMLPITNPSRLYFRPIEMPPTLDDHRFENIIGSPRDEVISVAENYLRYQIGGAGNRIGGYPTFTQGNPLHSADLEAAEKDPLILLLQLDSSVHGAGIMFGDLGIAHFWIRESALIKRDFSRILYQWDCY